MFYFAVSVKGDDFNQITIRPGADEIERVNNEIKRNISKKTYFTEACHPFSIKQIFSTLGSIIKSSINITGSQIASNLDDSIGHLLGFQPVIIHEE